MRRWMILILLGAMLAGCAAPAQEPAALCFTDDLGREIRLPGQPERVACLLGSFAEVWMLAGGQVIAAPDDAWEDLALPLPEEAVVLGSAKNLSLELLLQAEPDLILASTNTAQHLQWQDTLDAAGIPTAYFDVSDFDDYLRLLKLCTDITGRADLYELSGTAIQSQIDQAVAQAQECIARDGNAPTVLYLRIAASGIRVKSSRGNVLGQMLESLGCVNIADSDQSLLEHLSMEHILLADPDCILLVPQGDDEAGAWAALEDFFRENPAWQTLSAVQAGRVYSLDKRRYSLKPNALWGEAYLELVEILWNENP